MEQGFSRELQQFIAENIRSVCHLEMLLLLRSDKGRSWTCEDLSRSLYIASEMCAQQLQDLESRGLISVAHADQRRFQYAPRHAEHDALVGQVAELYQERRVSVITAIYAAPIDKVRTFAEAFRIRKEN